MLGKKGGNGMIMELEKLENANPLSLGVGWMDPGVDRW